MTRRALGSESGQVLVVVALLLPVLFGLGGIVIGVGNWFTHARHLQTKADAGALAGGSAWEFPCGPEIDARIEALARLYAGSNNPQVGGVPDSSIHTVLNGSDWYDDDSNPAPVERNDPNNPSICETMTLDVKVTEDDTFPLFSLLPVFPDIKRKARVEIQEAEGIFGLLPIAVRAPEPTSVAAAFFDEASGNLLAVRYFVKDPGNRDVPAGLQPWTTRNPEDTGAWATFTPSARTGVAIAISFRGACNTNLPNPNTKIVTSPAPCLEDEVTPSTIGAFCNQGGQTQIVNCYYATGSWPNETVQAGLQFIRGYVDTSPGNGPPAIEKAYLTNLDCPPSTSYFNASTTATCHNRLTVTVDLGTLQGLYPNPPGPDQQGDLRASDVEVRWCNVTPASNNNNACNGQFGTSEDMLPSGPNATGTVTFATTPGTDVTLQPSSGPNALALQIRLRNARNHQNPACRGNNFSNQCRYRYTAATVTTNDLTRDQILSAPIQRAFRGNTLTAGSIQWLRLSADQAPCGNPIFSDTTYDEAASIRSDLGASCFYMEMGLKGGLAQSANEQPILFNDGAGPSQMGSVDCDPNIQQGQELIEGVRDGCSYWYAKHPFDWNPLCPTPNNLFAEPNPGPPWDDGRWPPLRCIKTRPTGTMNQLEEGFKLRFFGNRNQNTCPAPADGYVRGRNYWDKDTPNGYTGSPPFGFKEGTHNTRFPPGDPRIVTIFLAPSEAFAGSGQKTFPIAGFIEVYITGFGPMRGAPDDPCPGNTPPPEINDCQGNACGYAMWGHIINYRIPDPNATPSGRICQPGESFQPCVAVLVE